MVYLTIAIVLVGVLVLFDLLLTLGLVRRLRSHAEALAAFKAPEPAVHLPQIGTAVTGIAGVTSDGEPVSAGSFPEGAVVGFFSTWCDACAEQLPEYLEYAGALGHNRVLSVVQGDQGLPELVGTLAKVGRVVVEEDGGPIAKAFDIHAYPTLAIVDSGWQVTASALSVDELTRR